MLTSVVRFNYNSARANQLQPNTSCLPRRSCLKNPRRLIANPRLEFQISPIRISELKFPNRIFSAILPRTRGPLEPRLHASSVHNPWPPRLIGTQRLENAITPINPATSNFLIGTKTGFSQRNSSLVVSPLPRPQGFATYRLGNCSRRLFIFGISQIWM